VAKRLSCQHSGFSVDNPLRIEAGGAQGRQQLARSTIHAPLSLDKTGYKPEREVIVYRSKLHAHSSGVLLVSSLRLASCPGGWHKEGARPILLPGRPRKARTASVVWSATG